MTGPNDYPDSLTTVPAAATVSGAVSIAERHIDEIGTVEAFIDFAQAAYLRGRSVETPSEIPHAKLDSIERRARASWEMRQYNPLVRGERGPLGLQDGETMLPQYE